MKEPTSKTAIAIGLCVAFSAGCEVDDVGEACADEPSTSIGVAPVGGEEPWVEVVRMKRDGACESFRCLRHLGLAPYCTRECEIYESDEAPAPCTKDGQCSGDKNCADDGFCREDDCPPGFKCIHVQEVGPLAENSYCVRRINCEENLDCRSLGAVDCVEHSCYDPCYALTADEECEFHQRICEPNAELLTHLECSCQDEKLEFATCSDELMMCKAQNSPYDLWDPQEAPFIRFGVCLHKEVEE